MVNNALSPLKHLYHVSLLFLVLLSLLSQLSFSAPTVTLSRMHIATNESVELVVNLDKDETIPSDFTQQLKQHFSIENLGRSSETSCVNFDCTNSYKTTYLLSPKAVGLFTIPALRISTGKSKPLQIKVTESNNDPEAGDLQDVFIELNLDKKQAYVDEQVLLTLKINSAIQLTNVQLSPIEVDNLSVKELNKTNYQRNLGGVPYTTYEITFALFAKASGDITIPSVRATGLIPDGRSMGFGSFFNSGKRINIRSNSLNLKILPIPQGVQGDWLPAQSVIIKDNWLSDLGNAKVGESITGEITLSALGLSSEQLPSININESPNYKLYLEKPELDNHQNDNGIIGIRKEKFAIVPNKAGDIVIPKISIRWWDIATESFKTAKLPAKTITIKPNADIQTPEPVTTNALPSIPDETGTSEHQPITDLQEPSSAKSSALLYISLLLNAILLLLCSYLWLTRKKSSPEKDASDTTSKAYWQTNLTHACKSQDANAIKRALITAVKASSGKRDITSLSDLGRLYNTAEAKSVIEAIENASYQQESLSMDAEKLITVFSLNPRNDNSGLEDLYPTH